MHKPKRSQIKEPNTAARLTRTNAESGQLERSARDVLVGLQEEGRERLQQRGQRRGKAAQTHQVVEKTDAGQAKTLEVLQDGLLKAHLSQL
jgi:hypothetical protein